MKSVTSWILGLTLAAGSAGLGLAAQAPKANTQAPAKTAKVKKHRKHHKKAVKTARSNKPAK